VLSYSSIWEKQGTHTPRAWEIVFASAGHEPALEGAEVGDLAVQEKGGNK